jgi:hypothetical protein
LQVEHGVDEFGLELERNRRFKIVMARGRSGPHFLDGPNFRQGLGDQVVEGSYEEDVASFGAGS